LVIAGLACVAVFSSCSKKADEVTPNVTKPNVTVSFLGADYGVQKDFDVSATVSTTGDSAFINISVNGSTGQEMNRIYMTYQKDSDKEDKFTKFPNGTSIPAAGYSGTNFDGSNVEKFNYNDVTNTGTFNIPSGKSKDFKLTIPILLRTDATSKSDVFKVWIVKGGKSGDHKNPAKNLAYGVAFVKLNYTNEALISNYETVLGSSKNDTIGSLFSTSTGSNFKRSFAQDTLMGSGIDFVFNNFTSGTFTIGSFYKDASTTNSDVTVGFKQNPGGVDNIKRILRIAESTIAAWDGVVGEASLVSAVNGVSSFTSFVTYTSDISGKVFAFITADGKKGLIKVVSVDNANTIGCSATLQVKVQR